MTQETPAQAPLSVDQIEAWRQAIRASTFGNYRYEMGVALEREGSRDAARVSYEQALHYQPDHHAARVRLINLVGAETAQGVALRQAGLAIDPGFTVRGLCGNARQALRDGRLATALATVRQARVIDPVCVPAQIIEVTALAMEGNVAAAENQLSALADIAVSPDDELLQDILWNGQGLVNTGRLSAAYPIYLLLLKMAPERSDIRRTAAFIAQATGHLADAVRLFQETIAAAPDDADLYTDLAQTCYVAGDFEAAYRFCAQGIALKPQDPCQRARNTLALALLAAGRLDDAAATLEATGVPATPTAQWTAEQFFSAANLGLLRLVRGDLAGAEPALLAAQALAPADDWVASTLAVLYRRQGRDGDAAVLFQTIAQNRPEWATFLARMRPALLADLTAGFSAQGLTLGWE